MIGALFRMYLGSQMFIVPFILLASMIVLLPMSHSECRMVLLAAVVFGWLFGLQFVGLERRYSEFQIMQPVSSGLLVAVRVAVLCLFALAPLAVITAGIALFGGEGPAVLPIAVNLGTAVVFASLVIQMPNPGYSEIAERSKVVAPLGLALTGIFIAPWTDDLRFGLLLLVTTAVLARTLARSVPPGLLLGARARRAEEALDAQEGDVSPSHRWLLAGWILFRCPSVSGLAACFSYFFMIFAATVAESLTWTLFALTMVPVGTCLQGLQSVGHLPLSRRQLFPYVALPPFVLLVIGVTAAGALRHTLLTPAHRTHFEPVDLKRIYPRTSDGESDDYAQVVVPASRWRLGIGQLVPPIRAPWGEEVSPDPHLFSFWGLPIHLYNPYEISASSSIEFVSWQLSRAVEDVYRARISPEDLRKRYLEVTDDGTIRVRQRIYTLQEVRSHPHRRRLNWDDSRPFPLRLDHPELVAGPPRTLATVLATVFLVWVVVWALSLYWSLLVSRPPTTLKGARRRSWVGGSIFLVWAFVAAVVFGAWTSRQSWDLRDPSVYEVVVGVTLRVLAESLPENGLLCWVVVLSVGVACYLFLERSFSKMEVPCALVQGPRSS